MTRVWCLGCRIYEREMCGCDQAINEKDLKKVDIIVRGPPLLKIFNVVKIGCFNVGKIGEIVIGDD